MNVIFLTSEAYFSTPIWIRYLILQRWQCLTLRVRETFWLDCVTLINWQSAVCYEPGYMEEKNHLSFIYRDQKLKTSHRRPYLAAGRAVDRIHRQ